MKKNGTRLVFCSSCNRRGDSMREHYLRTITESASYNLEALNASTRKSTSRQIVIGIFKKCYNIKIYLKHFEIIKYFNP